MAGRITCRHDQAACRLPPDRQSGAGGALKNPTLIAELKKHPHLVAYVYTRGIGVWQVSLFTPPPKPAKPQIEMLQLYVSDQTGEVTQVWTGYQVAWTMARGYPGRLRSRRSTRSTSGCRCALSSCCRSSPGAAVRRCGIWTC